VKSNWGRLRVNDRPAACLLFGIYDKGETGIIDRHECSVFHGDTCSYEVAISQPGTCLHWFGTGFTVVGSNFDLLEGVEVTCSCCAGTGQVLAQQR